jgi:hypothetical protein
VSPSINAPQEEVLAPNQAATRLHLSESSLANALPRRGSGVLEILAIRPL